MYNYPMKKTYTPQEIYNNPLLLESKHLRVRGNLNLSYSSPISDFLQSLSLSEREKIKHIASITPYDAKKISLGFHFKISILPEVIEVDGSLDLRLQSNIKNISSIKIKVKGRLDLAEMNLSKLPDCTGSIVFGDFDCSSNMLKSLEGSPLKVTKQFRANKNKLRSTSALAQAKIGGLLDLSDNPLFVKEVTGLPKKIGGVLYLPYKLKNKYFEGENKYRVSYNSDGDGWG